MAMDGKIRCAYADTFIDMLTAVRDLQLGLQPVVRHEPNMRE
jgi:hypothetical protein